MRLKNDIEFENTRQKLAELRELMAAREHRVPHTPNHDLVTEGMVRWERKLQAEIQEYEALHQSV